MDAYRPLTCDRECHAIGCTVAVMPRMLMCRSHWFAVPLPLRQAVWRTYREGKGLSREYLIAAREAIHAVAVSERRLTIEEAERRMARLQKMFDYDGD